MVAMATGSAWAQSQTVTSGQRATANQVAQTGVPLSELAPNAPDSHTVVRGDTLWRISDLLHVPHGAYINAKMRAKQAAGAA